jgi:excisionase family DNA binding protein
MSESKLLTIREVSRMLDITEKEVLDLAEKGTIPAYKVGEVYVRFKKDQVEEFKMNNKELLHREYSWRDRVFDFVYFYDFYIFSIAVICFLLFIILKK